MTAAGSLAPSLAKKGPVRCAGSSPLSAQYQAAANHFTNRERGANATLKRR